MKKTILYGALLTIMYTQIQAEPGQQPIPVQTPGVTNANQAPTATNPLSTAAQPVQAPTTAQQPVQTVPTLTAHTVVNCEYKIPAETKKIDDSFLLNWSQKAVIQAFEFSPQDLANQMEKLKSCFTDQGWIGFSSALEKSGNLTAIKAQNLTVSSQLNGQSLIIEAKNNQWKLTLPIEVVYQNDKEKVTQLLTINLTVSRKISGDLGIVQIIATPQVTVSMQGGAASTPSAVLPTPIGTTSATSTVTNSNGPGGASSTPSGPLPTPIGTDSAAGSTGNAAVTSPTVTHNPTYNQTPTQQNPAAGTQPANQYPTH